MSIKSKIKTFFFLDDEYDDNNVEEYEEENAPVAQQQKQKPQHPKPQNVVSLQSVQKSSKLILIEPRVYSEAQEIADHLKNRRAVIVNLQRIEHDQPALGQDGRPDDVFVVTRAHDDDACAGKLRSQSLAHLERVRIR